MPDLVLISTHRLPLAGTLREAFAREGFDVDLIPSPDHLTAAQAGAEPVLAVLTGEREGDGEAWVRKARDELGLPVFVTLPGGDGAARGRNLGAVEIFPPEPDPAEMALVGRRTVERRRLQALTGIVGESEEIREVLERLVQIAPVASTVLLTGESGTGKELVARGIHALSPRKHRAFLAVNVAAVSETLLESELFGHEKGAFTGAIDARKGFFQLADRGTLFLDEIGEMPKATQTKLLRVLEQREFLRVGGEQPIKVDVRILAATNRDLRELVVSGEFRRDLYYRLNILDIRVPPLRERREDIPLLIHHFVREISERMDRPFPGIRAEAMRILQAHDWPGNVRELRNLVESMVVLSPGREIGPEDIPREVRSPDEGRRLLPVHVPRPPPPREREGGEERSFRPELEFVFRTLVELRVDVEELRREFEAYREDMGHRLEGGIPQSVDSLPRLVEGGTVHWPEPRTEDGGVRDEPGEASSTEAEEPEEGRVIYRPGMTMEELEEEAIRTVLQEVEGNRRRAAERLGIGERTLYRKIRKYGIDG
jgi:DNA-binding NtrC family response regulator